MRSAERRRSAAGEFWERHGASLCKRLHSLPADSDGAIARARYYALSADDSQESFAACDHSTQGTPDALTRRDDYGRKRVFGSTAQWIAVAILLVLAVVILWMVTY